LGSNWRLIWLGVGPGAVFPDADPTPGAASPSPPAIYIWVFGFSEPNPKNTLLFYALVRGRGRVYNASPLWKNYL